MSKVIIILALACICIALDRTVGQTPGFLEEPQDTEVRAGEEGRLRCVLSDNRDGTNCFWERNNQEVSINVAGRYAFTGDLSRGDCSIRISESNVDFDDGYWACGLPHTSDAVGIHSQAAKYTVLDSCDANFTGSSGNLESPGYPGTYNQNLNCSYLISTPQKTAVSLDIVTLDLADGDFIDIYDGPTNDSKLIGQYSGQQYNVFIDASTNQVFINFRSDKYGPNATGFDINFKERKPEKCEEHVVGTFGSILSPGYLVEPYANNLECYYRITTPNDTAATLHVVTLVLENDYDYIDIFDGPNDTYAKLGRYTGSQYGLFIYASTNEAFIHFHTDASEDGPGFYIYFTERGYDPICPAINYQEDSGFIYSPLFGEKYQPNSDCYYSIKTSPDTQITFHTLIFDVEAANNCTKDFVEIFDGPSDMNKTLAKACGSDPINDIISSTNEVFVYFHSDDNTEGLGFNISYSTDPCPINPLEYSGSFGTIYSPGYPLSNYSNFANCKYNIVTAVGSQVGLQVNYLNLGGSSSECQYDFLQIYDGDNSNARLMSTLCGTVTYEKFLASTNMVYLYFHSNGSNTYPGFSITYTESFNRD